MVCYLVRHGQDDDSIRGGWSNSGLIAIGVEQVNKLANEILQKNIVVDCIYSSDLQRAKETAEILEKSLHAPIIYDSAFREANNGDLAGMKHEIANEKYPGVYWSALDYSECYPNGESPELFYNRVNAAWINLKLEIQEKSLDNVMLVTHGGVIEVILCIENGIEFSNKEKHFSTPAATLLPIEMV